jgi:hypothetical protein
MNMNEACLRHIDKVRQVATGMEPAYLARTRLGRLILACLRTITAECDLDEPVLPMKFEIPENASQWLKELTQRCNNIYDLSRFISQPSEPLEDRWKEAWTHLLQELDELEQLLQTKDTQTLSHN